MNQMNFGLLIIGDEILSGKREDKHVSKVIALLSARGLQLSWANYVGDDRARVTAALRTAFASGDCVFSTGGIGSTPDDHTRHCAAAALDRPMQRHPQAAGFIMERIAKMAQEKGWPLAMEHPDNQQRLEMADFPVGARIIPNNFNQIAGFSTGLNPDAPNVHFVPGFPVMAWPMIEWVLDTHYAAHFHSQTQIERAVIVLGAIEAQLTPLMLEIEALFTGIKVFSLPSVSHPEYGAHIELGVKGNAPEHVEQAFAHMVTGLGALHAKWLNTP